MILHSKGQEKPLFFSDQLPYLLCFADCEQLIKRMLCVDPARRIELRTVEQHSWCRQNMSKEKLRQLEEVEELNSLAGFANTLLSSRHETSSKQLAFGLGGLSLAEQGAGEIIGVEPTNQKVLQVMQHLGIDLEKTAEV